MSWLNLNQSLNSLKGQITNFASEVLAEAPVQESGDVSSTVEPSSKELEEKCRNQELEIAALKRLTNELEATLQSERLSRKNGVKEEESSWYWDPPTQTSKSDHQDYVQQILTLQDEISNLKDSINADIRPDFEEEVSRLREENKNLTTNLEDLDSQHQMAMEKLLMLKKELQKNFEVLKQEHEDLKNSNDDYSTEIQNLLAKIGQRDEEIKHLKASKTDYDSLHHKYLNLEKVHSVLRENAEKFQEENQELHEEVFKLQEQVTKLEHEIEVATKHTEMSNCVPRERYDELVKELSEVKHRRNSNQLHLDESNIDDNAKGVIETLKRDINELKHKLNQKYDKDYSDHSIIKSEKIMQLYNKYVNFELPVDYIGQMPSSNDNIVLYKLESAFKTLNSFKKNIDTLEHKLSEKNHNINHLQTQIDDLTTENDFLTTDIQHFEGELNEMKKNNDFLISEIAALKNTSKLEPIIETTHEDNLAKLESELADSNKINKTFESEIKRIQSELDEVKTEKTKLQESLHDLRTKYTAMLSEFETCKTETKAVEEFEHNTKNEHYHKIKNLMTDEIDDLKKRLHAANAKNEQLSIDIHIIENDKVLLTKQVDDLKHALEEKSSEHKELESMKKSLDHKLQELENKLDELIKHKQLLEKDKTNLEQKVNVLQSEVSCKSNETQHTAAELEKVTSDKIKLSEKLAEIIKENSTLLETVEKLNNELTNFKQSEKELFTEKSALKNTCQGEAENITLLQQTIEDLKAKMIQQEVLNNEILFLKEENHKILQSKLQLETELSSTDSKIAHLEEEFEKLITDLNEKDNLIDSLNTTITHNNIKLLELNQNVTDLGNSVDIKNLEIQRLTKSLAEVTEKLNDTSTKSDLGFEELKKLHNEKEDLAKQILNLHEEVHIKNIEMSKLTRQIEELKKTCTEHNAEIKILHSEKEELNKQFIALTKEVTIKNIQISELTNQLEELGKNCADYVATIDNKDKEIKELNQSIVELTDKIKTTDNTTHQNDDYAKLAQEKQSVEQELIEIKSNHTLLESELTETKTKFEQVEKTCLEYKTYLENATREKNELINLVNLKHNESIQYHNEIQRLNHVLLEQTNEFKKIVEDKDRLIQNHSENCMNCEQLRIVIKEKDDIIISLNQNATDYETVKAELLNASETIKNLTERCENLDKSLAIQLEAVKKLTAENVQLSEQEQNSTKELERLRHHLVEMEENYTQELMTSEQKLTECQTRLHQVEQRAKQTSTVYTSNSIRANQEVETLRNQIKLLEKQREEVQTKLSEAEDARSRSEAALTNLQVVLEQFQLDKERDIHAATEKIRNKMEDLKRENRRLHDEIAKLNAKLEESLAGLEAATRLGDQVETKTAQINDLKEQVRTLETSVSAAEERYYNAISNQQDKVDKNLVKNLVINYVLTAAQNNLNKTQVLRILSTVLDFNQQECEKLGLVRSSTAPDSLAAEFVKFLQDESRPRATLPNMMGLAHNSSRSSTPTSRKSSTLGPQPNPFDTGHKRNPSTGSNNLLFQNLDHLETTSQVSIESETKEPRVVGLDTGVNQTRSSESAILKYVLKDM